jgi:hypothetical protein
VRRVQEDARLSARDSANVGAAALKV